jgi:CheY-like chemotaxis protein
MDQAFGTVKVLLVEDELLISELVSDVLTEHGYQVHAVVTAAEALHAIEKDMDFDVLFTDINLPGDMDGAELARQVRALRPDMKIVYASGRHSATTIAPLVSRSLFLNKPYNPDDVCTLIGRLTTH